MSDKLQKLVSDGIGSDSCCTLVSPAYHRHSIAGKPGRTVDGVPAKVSFAGVIWSSPVPRDADEAAFFNQAVSRIYGKERTC